MSEECACGSCQGDGYNAYEELRERLLSNERVVEVFVEQSEDDTSLINRQWCAIQELVGLIGYLPQAHAVLERHGLR